MSSTSEVDSEPVQDTTDSIVAHSSHEENQEFSLSPVPTPQREVPATPAPRRSMHDRKPPSVMKNYVYQFDVRSTPNMQIDKVHFDILIIVSCYLIYYQLMFDPVVSGNIIIL